MDILVCIKQVPDTAENDIELAKDGRGIDREDMVYSINEWDNYAVEEAIQLRDTVGGSITVVTIGDEEADDVLRRQLAMGADRGLHVCDQALAGSDGLGLATILAAVVRQGKYDLILTGAQADDCAGQVGGMLAALLDVPFAALVNQVEVKGQDVLRIGREVAGGDQEISEIDLPCVLSIQTGINQPRYVGIRGIRKVASVEIPQLDSPALGLDPASVGDKAARLKRLDYFVPQGGPGAQMLTGKPDQLAAQLVEILKAKGGLR